MRRLARVHVDWVSAASGGRSSPPHPRMRAEIRWSRYVEKWLAGAWDVEVVEFHPGPGERSAMLLLRFTDEKAGEDALFKEGEQIELLEGARVIAVGRILPS